MPDKRLRLPAAVQRLYCTVLTGSLLLLYLIPIVGLNVGLIILPSSALVTNGGSGLHHFVRLTVDPATSSSWQGNRSFHFPSSLLVHRQPSQYWLICSYLFSNSHAVVSALFHSFSPIHTSHSLAQNPATFPSTISHHTSTRTITLPCLLSREGSSRFMF